MLYVRKLIIILHRVDRIKSPLRMPSLPTLALVTNIPAPYRVPVWNELARLTGGRVWVSFTTAGDPRRTWAVPTQQMHFDWQLLSDGNAGGWLSPFRSGASMLRFLVCSHPQSVICGGYDSLAAWVTFAWCKATRTRFVLWLEATMCDSRRPSWIKRWLKRRIVFGADAIAASGKATVEYVKALGAREERIFIAPFGGDHEGFAREAAAADAAREKEGHGWPSRLVLYSGRLVREKGVFVLLEAFRLLTAEFLDVGLLIVGHGPDRQAMGDDCRRLGLERVYFAGAQEYKRMPYFYALADVLVLPTLSDPWGFVVNEAFACGVPAIVSRVAGACDDLIVEGETGFTVEPGDPQDLAAKMRRLLEDEPLRAAMGRSCREVIRRYSAEACAEGLLLAAQAPEGRQNVAQAARPGRRCGVDSEPH
jgi:glycosyltransferase involved in cell wall biosynthesis